MAWLLTLCPGGMLDTCAWVILWNVPETLQLSVRPALGTAAFNFSWILHPCLVDFSALWLQIEATEWTLKVHHLSHYFLVLFDEDWGGGVWDRVVSCPSEVSALGRIVPTLNDRDTYLYNWQNYWNFLFYVCMPQRSEPTCPFSANAQEFPQILILHQIYSWDDVIFLFLYSLASC